MLLAKSYLKNLIFLKFPAQIGPIYSLLEQAAQPIAANVQFSSKRCFETCFNVSQYLSLYPFWQNHLEGRLAPNWPPDFCHLGAETCAAPWCPCPHGSLLIGGGMPAVPLSGLPGSAVPTEEAPGLSCRHPEPETKRPQKSGNPPFGQPLFRVHG